MTKTASKPTPEKLRNEHLIFLDDLRESNITSMFGAGVYLERKFKKLTRQECREILGHWMRTFSERHPKGPQ